jgi:hypothetical protein
VHYQDAIHQRIVTIDRGRCVPARSKHSVISTFEIGIPVPAKEGVPLVLGMAMTLYEVIPEVMQKTLSELPPEVRIFLHEQGPRARKAMT